MSRKLNYSGEGHRFDVPDQQIVEVSEDIAIMRGELVAESMIYAGVIRSIPGGVAKSSDSVECVRAAVQDRKATAGHQAAHLLPGQIRVNKKFVWDLADSQAAEAVSRELGRQVFRLYLTTKNCFAKTNNLPACFNRADSGAEGSSTNVPNRLKTLFGECMQQLWFDSRENQSDELLVDRVALKGALDLWFLKANSIYQEACERKLDKATTLTGEKKTEREKEALVLKTYADSFKVVNSNRFLSSNCRSLFAQYT